MKKLLVVIITIMCLITMAIGIYGIIEPNNIGPYKYVPILTGFIAIVCSILLNKNHK